VPAATGAGVDIRVGIHVIADFAPISSGGRPWPGGRALYTRLVRKLTSIGWVLAVLACGAVLRLPTFVQPLLSDDEAIYAATADAMRKGDLLYQDVVDHKPPLIYHVYQGAFALFGDYETHGVHLFVVLAVLATAGLLWRLGARGPGGFFGGAVAASLWLVFSTTWHAYDALAANCELFLLVPQSLAALLLLSVFERPRDGVRWGSHLVIGLLIGVAALFKYQALTFLGVSLGMLLYGLANRQQTRRWVLTAMGLQIAGAMLPAVIYLIYAGIHGSADDAIRWFRFNFLYVDAGLTGLQALGRGAQRLALIGGVALVPYALGVGGAVSTGRGLLRSLRPAPPRGRGSRPPPFAVELLALLWLLTSALAVCAGGRFFGHYFHLVLPPLCLLASAPFLRMWRASRVARRWLVALSAVPAVAFFLLATVARPLAARLDHADPPYQPVAARIAALAPPRARIFVWGNSPQLYILARRSMGSRFSFCNYMTGESPGTPTETGERDASKNSYPPAWDMLFADLELRRPLLFVDAAAAGWDGYDKFPVDRYPELARYRAEHYRPVESEQGVILYVRR
jgi:hypothetical protein